MFTYNIQKWEHLARMKTGLKSDDLEERKSEMNPMDKAEDEQPQSVSASMF